MTEIQPLPHQELDALLDPDCNAFCVRCQERQQSHEEESPHHHEHEHDHHAPEAKWRLITMLVLTGIFFIAELITGFMTGSLALQSDAFHMFTDEASLVVGLVASIKSKGGPTKKMSFGWGRAQVIGGLANSVFLMAICLTIFIEAIVRFIELETIDNENLFIIVGVLGLLVNVLGMFIFHDHGHDDNLEGVFLHIFGDLLGSIGVVISGIVVKFASGRWRYYLDPAISLLIVILLAFNSTRLFIRTSSTVMEATPSTINTDEIISSLTSVPGLISVHELHVWQLSNESYLALAHIVVDSKEHHRDVQKAVHNLMMEFGIFSTTVQIEYLDDYPENTNPEYICSYSSSYGADKRAFFTPGLYQHCIGCPHQHGTVEAAVAYEHAHTEHEHDHDDDSAHEDHDHDNESHSHDHDEHSDDENLEHVEV